MITPLFHPGQTVVCVNDEFTILKAQDPRIVTPVKGKQYVVRQNFQLLHAVGITLEGLDNTHAIPKGRKLEPNFNQNRFSLPQAVTVTEEEEVGELVAS